MYKETIRDILKYSVVKWKMFLAPSDNGYASINPYEKIVEGPIEKKDADKIKNYFSGFSDKIVSGGSTDGTGIVSSVDKIEGKLIADYIYRKFNVDKYDFKPVLLDVGAGQGYLTQAINEKMIGFGVEGSKNLLGHFVSDNVYICDLTKKIDPILSKAFNITTSFEVIEHVAPDEQAEFWKNLRYLSDYHVCSIHNCPPVTDGHRAIWTNEQWLSFFEKNQIEVIEVISQEIFNKECVGYPKNKKYIPIKNIRGHWPCSLFYILKFV
jgi:hypothetical protein